MSDTNPQVALMKNASDSAFVRLPGLGPYKSIFGLQFYDASDEETIEHYSLTSTGARDRNTTQYLPRVIVPDALFGFPYQLSGKTVALVGNGSIEGCGKEIDAHDEVIRMDTLRNWKGSIDDDGTRLSMWAGHAFKHFSESQEGALVVSDIFSDIAMSGTPMWFISPYHIPAAAYKWLKDRNILNNVMVAPSQFASMDKLCHWLEPSQVVHLFSMPIDKPQYLGLSRFELLLSGTKTLLFLAICGVKSVSMYGFDLFKSEPNRLWDGHNVKTDLWLIDVVKSKIEHGGGVLHWNEEAAVRQAYS